jgi:hypothetical protein
VQRVDANAGAKLTAATAAVAGAGDANMPLQNDRACDASRATTVLEYPAKKNIWPVTEPIMIDVDDAISKAHRSFTETSVGVVL